MISELSDAAAALGALKDSDRFILRAARRWDEISGASEPSLETWCQELSNIATGFWQLNELSRDAFSQASYRRLIRTSFTNPLADAMRDFKQEVESQHRKDFGNPPQETVGQNLLSIFLNARKIRVRKEVDSGAGRTDIFPLVDGPVIETKVPRSVTEYKDGKVELGQYLDNEGKDHGIYVVFADRENATHSGWLGESFAPFTEQVDGKTIEIFPVDIGLTYPSRLGRTRRARQKD